LAQPLLPLLPLLPFGESGLIAFERIVVEIENTRIAAAMTTVVKVGLHGRLRLRVVDRCDSGHGENAFRKGGKRPV
jgi:hypothetical protein